MTDTHDDQDDAKLRGKWTAARVLANRNPLIYPEPPSWPEYKRQARNADPARTIAEAVLRRRN